MKRVASWVVLQACFLSLIHCQVKVPVPKIDGSYRAMGEIVFSNEDTHEIDQLFFEENFDKENGLSSFHATMLGSSSLIVEDLNRQQAWVIENNDCQEISDTDFKEPTTVFSMYQLLGGREVFPIRQLLHLKDENIKKWNGDVQSYRDIPSLNYEYSINTTDNGNYSRFEIESYWSDGSQVSPSKFKTVPLGFKVTKILHLKSQLPQTTLQFINLFGFTHDEINQEMFLPIRGVACPGLQNATDFPDVSSLKAFSFKSEIVFHHNHSTSFLDFWLDSANKLLQIEEHLTLSNPTTTSIRKIFSLDQGVFYSYSLDDSVGKSTKNPEVKVISNASPFHPQYLLDLRKKQSANAASFFGTDKWKYVKTGTTMERGIACTIFQAVRDDWPPQEYTSFNTKTVWEWCFADGPNVTFPGDGFPLISLRIHVVKTGDSPDGVDWLREGNKISFHFYQFKKLDEAFLDTAAFDISPCFTANHKVPLQFRVTLQADLEGPVSEETSNVLFDHEWQSAITSAAGLKPSSLRVSRVRTDIPVPRSPMLVKFTLLNRHPDLPASIRKNEPDLEKAKNSLRSIVDKNDLRIKWTLGKNKEITLIAVSGSLQPQPIAQMIGNLSTNIFPGVSKENFLGPSGIFYGVRQPEVPQESNSEPINLTVILSVALLVGLLVGSVSIRFYKQRCSK